MLRTAALSLSAGTPSVDTFRGRRYRLRVHANAPEQVTAPAQAPPVGKRNLVLIGGR